MNTTFGKGLMTVFVLVAAAASAQAPTPRPQKTSDLPIEGVITTPDWEHVPDGDEMSRFYPRAAALLDISGRVQLRCSVTAVGSLENCEATEERPAGLGFGHAGVKLATYFHMKPQTVDGVAIGGATVNIPLSFKLPQSTPTKALAPATIAPAKLALARRLYVALGYGDLLLGQLSETFDYQVDQGAIDEGSDASQAPGRALVRQALHQAVASHRDGTINFGAAELAKRFSMPEMRMLLAFVTSPTGKKWIGYAAGNRDGTKEFFVSIYGTITREAGENYCKAAADCLKAGKPGS